jgi:hypothetical protein
MFKIKNLNFNKKMNFLFSLSLKSILVVLITITQFVNCNHYKGGVYTSFMPDSSSITFYFQMYYKRQNVDTAIFCDDNTINSQVNRSDGNADYIRMFYCDSNSCPHSDKIVYNFKCLNYDPINNWAQFENSVTLPLNSTLLKTNDRVKFSIENSSGAWSTDYWNSTNNINYAWTHTNRLIAQNTPPEVRSFAVFSIKCGCETKFRPIIVDPDQGDVIKCRKSEPNLKEGSCGSYCTSRYILNETTCTLTFPAKLDRSLPIELQVEDYNPRFKNGSEPMSSTSFQFNAALSRCTANPVCDNLPKFTDSLEPSSSCVAIGPGGFRVGKVEAYSIGNRVTEIRIFKDFVGFNYNLNNLVFNASTNTSHYDFNITIHEPSRIYQGKAIFEALDSASALSEQHIIDYVFNYEPVKLVLISNLSRGYCYDTLNSVELEFNWSKNISKPRVNNKARLMFVREDGKIQVEINTFLMSNQIEGNRFKVRLNKAEFSTNFSYSILYDFGIVTTDDYCSPSNEKMADVSRFSFLIADDSVSKVTFAKNNPNLASGNVSLDYTIQNAQLVACHLKELSELVGQDFF